MQGQQGQVQGQPAQVNIKCILCLYVHFLSTRNCGFSFCDGGGGGDYGGGGGNDDGVTENMEEINRYSSSKI